MKRDEILAQALGAIAGDRQRDYGDARDNFFRIARLWEPVLKEAGVKPNSITPEMVSLCMAQVKIARLCTTPYHQDSWIDIAGYAALGGEISDFVPITTDGPNPLRRKSDTIPPVKMEDHP